MKNYLQNKMQITFSLISSKNVDFDHVHHTGSFLIRARMNKLFLSNEAISIAVRDFLKI